MNSNAIVTLADSNYFELLIELIDSIKETSANKMFFGGVIPDVYSGIVVASSIK